MRMSDWSSDVCSSELVQGLAEALRFAQAAERDLDKLFDAISGGAAQSWPMGKHWKTMAADSFDFGFAVEIGRASCWESVCKYVWISGVAVSLKQKRSLHTAIDGL